MSTQQRRLQAIMFTDIVGYTSLMGNDVEFGLALLHQNRAIQKPLIAKHGGKWLKEMGDGVLAQFNTALDAVRCALEIQERASGELDAKIRIGIHLSDVVLEDGDVFGEGVNIASRVQSIADPGGIYITNAIYQAIRARKEIEAAYLGEVALKNVPHLVKTYYLLGSGLPKPQKRKIRALTASDNSPKRRLLRFLVACFLILLALSTGWWRFYATGPKINSLAILPIENISGGIDEEWLQTGIHHELIDAVGKLQSIRVISRTSVMKYLNSTLSVPEIAKELNVDGIVEASFYKEEDDLRIQVRLIQAKPDERQLWNEEFRRGMSNVLSLYNEVARSIATEIGVTLNSTETERLKNAPQIDPKAYEAYLRGVSHAEILTSESLNKALAYFNQALEIEPGYALAYCGIAWIWGTYMQQGLKPHSVAWPEGKKAAAKALSLDSNLDEVYRLLAITNTWWEWDWDAAGSAYQKALQINPNNSYVLAYYSHYLAFMGQAEEGLAYCKKALEIDPLNNLLQAVQGMALKNARKYDEALEWLLDVQEKTPHDPVALAALWAVYHELGLYGKALEAALRIYELRHDMEAVAILEDGFNEVGYEGAMSRLAEAMVARRKSRYFSAWQIGTLYARAHKKDECLTWLKEAYREHDANMPYISIDPLFEFLSEDARFKEILQLMGLPNNYSQG